MDKYSIGVQASASQYVFAIAGHEMSRLACSPSAHCKHSGHGGNGVAHRAAGLMCFGANRRRELVRWDL